MKKIDAEKLIRHLNQKWKNKTCPLCGNTQWTVSDKIHELHEYQDSGVIIGSGNIFPIVPITCINCGNTIFINPIIADAIKEQGE